MMDGVVSLGQSTLIHDRGGPPVFNTSRPGEVKHFVKYVDNLGVLSANREAVEEKAWLSCPVDSRRIISYPVVAFFSTNVMSQIPLIWGAFWFLYGGCALF